MLLFADSFSFSLASTNDSRKAIENLKPLFDEGVALMKEERVEEAKLIFSRLAKDYPTFPATYYYLGLIEMRHADSQEAIPYFEKSIELGARDGMIYYFLATALTQFGDLEKAKDVYKKAIEKKPGMVNAHHDLGTLYYRLSEFENSVNSFEKAHAIDPYATKTILMLGMAYIKNNTPEKALGMITTLRMLKDEKKASSLEAVLRQVQKRRTYTEPDANLLTPGSPDKAKKPSKPATGLRPPPRKPASSPSTASPKSQVEEKSETQSASNT